MQGFRMPEVIGGAAGTGSLAAKTTDGITASCACDCRDEIDSFEGRDVLKRPRIAKD
jgi:hypothetical protein